MSGLKPLRLFLSLTLGVCLSGCPATETDDAASSRHGAPVGHVELLTFRPDEDHFLTTGRRFPVEPGASLQDALQSLADQLTRSYFNDGPEPAPGIDIEVIGVHTIELPQRTLRVVAVDLRDLRQVAGRIFFQGSSGGQTTYYLLAATLMQPQLSPPLADGLVVLYNGKKFPELDHIRFSGLVSAESVRPVVVRAIQRRPPRPAEVSD
ncbi:MAG: hypothetical protein QNJ04_02000 [Desulfobacterales bacterium]|nr:hypothetical protein [Desulfobacterales bacterium]